MFSFTSIILMFSQYGYLIILPLAIVEGPIITILAGFIASQGVLNIIIVYIVVVVGDLLGDSIYYAIGRFSKRTFFNKYGHYIGMTASRIDKLTNYFNRHGGKTLMFGKLTHALGWPILVTAGIVEMPFIKYLYLNLLGTIPKSLGFLLLGYYVGYAYKTIDSYFNKIFFIIGVIIIIVGLIIFLIRRDKQNKIP